MVKNNFNLLRIILALSVFYYHMGYLGGNMPFWNYFPGEFAVRGFFVISGYLIVKSYLKPKSLRIYAKSRFLRIYPLYFMIIVLMFVVGYIHYSDGFVSYIQAGAGKYLFYNLIFLNWLQPSLPQLFIHGVIPSVNGALWTIKVEVMFYISVPIIYGIFARYINKKYLTILLMVASILCYYLTKYLITHYALNSHYLVQLPQTLVFFMVGAFFNFYKFNFLKPVYLILILPLLYYTSHVYFIYPFVVGAFIYIVAFQLKHVSIHKRIGDPSYGIYVIHFPLMQMLVMLGFFQNYMVGLLISTGLILILSSLSWHLIESKLLHKNY